jgi:hypothetical protein
MRAGPPTVSRQPHMSAGRGCRLEFTSRSATCSFPIIAGTSSTTTSAPSIFRSSTTRGSTSVRPSPRPSASVDPRPRGARSAIWPPRHSCPRFGCGMDSNGGGTALRVCCLATGFFSVARDAGMFEAAPTQDFVRDATPLPRWNHLTRILGATKHPSRGSRALRGIEFLKPRITLRRRGGPFSRMPAART